MPVMGSGHWPCALGFIRSRIPPPRSPFRVPEVTAMSSMALARAWLHLPRTSKSLPWLPCRVSRYRVAMPFTPGYLAPKLSLRRWLSAVDHMPELGHEE